MSKSESSNSPDRGGENQRLPQFSLESQSAVPYDGQYMKPGDLVANPNPMMPLLDAIWTRRTSRAYTSEPVDRETFEWLVSVAMNAPTACNEQQWKILHIEDPAVIRDLYERGSAAFIKNARQCFLVCYNKSNDNPRWHDHVQSGAAFISTFQLIAHTMGIGSCWICHLPNQSELKRMFGIHKKYDPVALVTYGYYRGKAKLLPRKHSAARIIMYDKFDSTNLVFASHRNMLLRRCARWLYYKIPAILRRRIRSWSLPYEKKFYFESFD